MHAARRLILAHPRQRGFTLVELLVTITLGLLVIAGIGQIYSAAKHSYDIQSSLARLQDTGRYAVDAITQDVRHAGYWGLTNMRATVPNGAVVPNGTCATGDTTWGSMVAEGIFGFNDGNGYACITNRVAQSGDILAVRYADPNPATAAAITAAPQRLYIRTAPAPIQTNLAQGDPANGAAAIFSDHAVIAHAYYVRNFSGSISCAGSVPELVQVSLNNGQPQPLGLVLGVEHLQFQFGLDTDGDRSVNQYVNANAVGNWNNVVSVRFWILVRDECPEAGYVNNSTYVMGDFPNFQPNDNYRRQLFTSTVALRD